MHAADDLKRHKEDASWHQGSQAFENDHADALAALRGEVVVANEPALAEHFRIDSDTDVDMIDPSCDWLHD